MKKNQNQTTFHDGENVLVLQCNAVCKCLFNNCHLLPISGGVEDPGFGFLEKKILLLFRC